MQWHNKWIMGANIGVRKPSTPPLHPQPTTNNSKNMVWGRGLSLLLFCLLLGHSVILPVNYPGLAGRSPTSVCLFYSSQLLRLPLRLCRDSQHVGFNFTSRLSFLLPSDKPISCST